MPKDVLERMTKKELILWIKENLFLKEKPQWSWVLGKRWEAAMNEEKALRKDFDNLLGNKYKNEQESLIKTLEDRILKWKEIKKSQQKQDKIWNQLKKAWEDETNERRNTRK